MNQKKAKLMRRSMGCGTKLARRPQDLTQEQRMFLRRLYSEYNTFNVGTRAAAGEWMRSVKQGRQA